MRFLNPPRDGAVLPIVHLNEHKISGPTVLGRASDDEIAALLTGHGYEPLLPEGDEPRGVHLLRRNGRCARDDESALVRRDRPR